MRVRYALSLLLATPILAALPLKGVDWTSLLIEERAGKTYKSASGQTQPLETILKNAGVNTVRQRIWVNPSNGDYNLDYNLKLAQRAKAAGLKIYLDFHYSDNWADPGKQVVPAAWKSLNREALIKQIYDYTKSVLDAFQRNNIPLAIVSIGNEITPGLLFPIGQLSSKPDGPRNVAALLKSASRAIKESSLSPKPKIMIHLDNGWKWETQQWWYDTVLGSGGGLTAADYDIQGVSYYPFYDTAASLSALGSSLQNMVRKYGKEVQVVETNWPTYCPNPSHAFPSDVKSIPLSVEGQKTWMREIAKRVEQAGNGKGTGLFYWEPAWISNSGLGSSCGWNLMVDDQGKDMGSLGVFGEI
ncbi:arabinogalactan endo-1,4-beta-galactosidase-like protein [Dendryphion nanum]|uniref:Arabinogalactan endo-beta-1,4-galactanase n=1 Tax=Dendryphion nanum TaxID=256645 RepID=A0A9P9IZJ4_9PLEO|nr:arabinogalactan endo-1,4-beta-galactosidase-like protein [Dendryphion nanum]